jgi:cysteinyl-tRNA synthetase
MLKLFNTLTRKKQAFKPIKEGEVGIYSCGPTVYWYQHIGNLKAYLFSDLLRRTLTFEGYKVKQVMNVTDVGHLTSDADEGEDKMEKAAKREGKNAQEIANYYWRLFKEDFKKLNIEEPNIWCKATDHIKEQIELIKTLEKKGYTYKTSDGIYFDTSKFKNYGKLALLDIKGLKAGARIEVGEKKNKTDFALWKFSETPGARQQEWASPWGIGFPGWHIECSAMSTKYLGQPIDIHTGGIDHIPIHHTNEIAQSECATGKKFVNYWLHENFLTLGGEKVSKSKGGLFTIPELEEKGFPPMVYRYFILTGHYRSPIEFSLDILTTAKTTYQRIKNIISEIKDDGKTNEKALNEFKKAMDDDLNTPRALAVLWTLIRDEKAKGKIGAIKEMDKVLGLKLLEKEEKTKIPSEIQSLLNQRQTARANKNWTLSDELRDKIKQKGFIVEDKSDGQKVSKV